MYNLRLPGLFILSTAPIRHVTILAMDSKRLERTRRAIVPLLVLVSIVTAITIVAAIWHGSFMSMFTNRGQLYDIVQDANILGPLVFIVVQVIQTVIAPVPGQVIGIAGGALFGWMGLVWSLIGSIIGAYIVFKVVRKFGRPFAERVVPARYLKRFDVVIERRGVSTLFLMFLVPIFPDSIMCYIAGLTKVPIRTLMVIWVAGRIPTALANNLIGEGLSREAIRPVIAVSLILTALAVFFYVNRKHVLAFVLSNNHIGYLKANWPYKSPRAIIIGLLLAAVFAGIIYLVLSF